jgi:4-amino-4-deoxy-L-arabinose transferase-like glycosyltransferase
MTADVPPSPPEPASSDEDSARQSRRGRWDRPAIFVLALVARLAVVAYAATRFPAAEDGRYYDKLADRLAEGAGYTWLWPDGVVTFAAHYPVGYPAFLAAGYRVFGHHVAVAMFQNALVGAVGVLALAAATRGAFGRRAGVVAGVLLALHPALLLYTPAVMTEGLTASVLSVSVYFLHRAQVASRGAPRAFWTWVVALGLSVGFATLIRPQSILIAPVVGLFAAVGSSESRRFFARSSRLPRLAIAAAVLGVALAVCAPWTARNCVRMKSCALVSVNGGWNLLIGSARGAASTGHWMPIDVPEPCKTVWDEAGKDACFGQAARTIIANDPLTFLSLVPRKLAATFDYCGAGPWYLHAASPAAFSEQAKRRAGVVETVFVRLSLLFALVAVSAASWRRPALGRLARPLIAFLCLGGAACLLHTHAAWSFVALSLLLLLAMTSPGRPGLGRTSAVFAGSFAVLATTILVHAVFFGAGRYSLVVLPFVTALGAAALTLVRRARDTA